MGQVVKLVEQVAPHVLWYQRFQNPSCFQTKYCVPFNDRCAHIKAAAGSGGLLALVPLLAP